MIPEEAVIRITERDFSLLHAMPLSPELAAELEHAYVVSWQLIPHDVVTMNSRVEFEDQATGERRVVTIAHPDDADVGRGRVSVLAPVGTALLGLAAGQSIDWLFPDGTTRRLSVIKVLFQPESAIRGLPDKGTIHRKPE